MTTIRIRKGLNGHRYSACDAKGNFLFNADKLSDIRKRYQKEIKWGFVELVRELDMDPDVRVIEETKSMIHSILQSYARRKKVLS